jgi:Methyltransferase domain
MTYRPPPLPTFDRMRETEDLIARKATDIARWSALDSLATQWDGRAAMAADWIPDQVRVLDLGCGAMTLGSLLKPGCTYFPADVVERREGCFVADLNRQEFPAGSYDWVSFLGVLEYIHDMNWALQKAREAAPNLLVTYCTHVGGDVSVRRGMGWVNDLNRAEFEAVLMRADWSIARQAEVKRGPTNIQFMYACSRTKPPSA